MPKRVQRLGQAAAIARAFVGLAREITVDTTEQTLRVHDGATPGGFRMARADASNLQAADLTRDGKMTAATFAALQNAQSNITTLQADVAANDADIAQLQTDVATAQSTANGKIAKIGSPTVGRLVTVAAGGELAQYSFSKDDIARIPVSTKAVFMQASAPLGWTLDATLHDRVIRLNNSVGGGIGGSWTITGFTVNGHVLTIAEMPSHDHPPASPGLSFNVRVAAGGDNNLNPAGTFNDAFAVTGLRGGDQPHSHGTSFTPGWRPLYADGIVCARAVNP